MGGIDLDLSLFTLKRLDRRWVETTSVREGNIHARGVVGSEERRDVWSQSSAEFCEC